MRVLVLSLLRLGDIILHRELAQALKRQNPDCEIHFLIHSEFESVQCLLPEVDYFHHLPRKEIQQILVERSQSALAAFQKLEGLISKINSLKFDVILNATHNNLSVRLMDLLIATEKRGVALHLGRKTADANSWQAYLNKNFSEAQGSRFHYLEVLLKSLELPVRMPMPAQASSQKRILLQVLTSDSKKNWGLERFHSLMQQLKLQFSDYQIQALCSPGEKLQVLKFFTEDEIVTPNLEEAAEMLKQTKLLITGDTSIQHLAAQNGCAVVSLFLGSADPVKTAPWQEGAWILQGQAPCAPCSHSTACFQPSHLCAQSISVSKVKDLVAGVLMGTERRVSTSGVWKNQVRNQTFATLPEVGTGIYQLEQAVWTAYLNSTEVQIQDVQWSQEEIQRIEAQHLQFQKALAAFSAERVSFEQIEQTFPQWKDCILGLKRNPKLASAWVETEMLCKIREQALNQILQNKGVPHGRESRKSFEARSLEA